MPLGREELAALLDQLDEALTAGCDHSLRFTRQSLIAHSLSESVIVPWLGEHRSYCDCEVLANVEDAWPRHP
jgi:hypothetical protein